MSAEKLTVYPTLAQTQDKNVSCARCNQRLNKCECKRSKRKTKLPPKLKNEHRRIGSGISKRNKRKSKPTLKRNPNNCNQPVLLNPDNCVEVKFCGFLSVPILDKTELQMADIAAIAAIAAELASASMPFQCPLSSVSETDIGVFLTNQLCNI